MSGGGAGKGKGGGGGGGPLSANRKLKSLVNYTSTYKEIRKRLKGQKLYSEIS